MDHLPLNLRKRPRARRASFRRSKYLQPVLRGFNYRDIGFQGDQCIIHKIRLFFMVAIRLDHEKTIIIFVE